MDSSNKVDSVDFTVIACASLHECAPISQRLAQASQQFDSNRPLNHGFTTHTTACKCTPRCPKHFPVIIFTVNGKDDSSTNFVVRHNKCLMHFT